MAKAGMMGVRRLTRTRAVRRIARISLGCEALDNQSTAACNANGGWRWMTSEYG